MGLFRFLRQWREKSDGTLTGPALETDSAEINNAPAGDNDALRWQEGFDSGIVLADGVDNSGGDNGWGQGASTTTTRSFASAFASVPNIGVVQDVDSDNVPNQEYKQAAINRSTTGFDMIFYQMAAVDRSGTADAYAVSYIAGVGRE